MYWQVYSERRAKGNNGQQGGRDYAEHVVAFTQETTSISAKRSTGSMMSKAIPAVTIVVPDGLPKAEAPR